MKKVFIFFVLALMVFTVYFYFRHPLSAKAVIHGYTIYLELAVTNTEKERGLGYRDSLPAERGMLFVYQNKDRYGFWMKGMRFPLDFIWITDDKVVDLSQNVGINAPPFSPRVPVDKVLEVNAGVIQSLGIHVGDTVQFTH